MRYESVQQRPPLRILNWHGPVDFQANFVISCKSSETNDYLRSERNISDKKLCRKMINLISRAIVSALTFVKGTANKYFVKTSIAVNT